MDKPEITRAIQMLKEMSDVAQTMSCQVIEGIFKLDCAAHRTHSTIEAKITIESSSDKPLDLE